MDEAERERIAQAVRAYIARQRMSREEFAHKTKLGKSTVDKLVTGLFSERTVIQVETHTGLKLLGAPQSQDDAPEEFGGYSRADAKPYLGQFTFARPSFREPDVIDAFATEIVWNETTPCLEVRARETATPAQLGRVYIPRASMHVFVLCNERGVLKQIILSQFDAERTMKGAMLTLGPVFGNVYNTFALPVFMRKCVAIDEAVHGEIGPGHPLHGEYRRILASVEADNFARWMAVGAESPVNSRQSARNERREPAHPRKNLHDIYQSMSGPPLR